MEQIEELISGYAGRPHMLLAALQRIQEQLGYVPPVTFAPLARALGVPEGEVRAVISFYTELRTEPPGLRRLRVCRGDSCEAQGAKKLAGSIEERLGVAAGEVTTDGLLLYDHVYCLGNCALSPSMALDAEVYGRATPQGALDLLQEARHD